MGAKVSVLAGSDTVKVTEEHTELVRVIYFSFLGTVLAYRDSLLNNTGFQLIIILHLVYAIWEKSVLNNSKEIS